MGTSDGTSSPVHLPRNGHTNVSLLISTLIVSRIQPPQVQVPCVTSATNISKNVASYSTRRSDENGQGHVYIVMMMKLAGVFLGAWMVKLCVVVFGYLDPGNRKRTLESVDL